MEQSHDLPAVVVAPLLADNRLEDASEALVSLTGLGAPLEKVENLTAMLDILEGLMANKQTTDAVDMVDRAQLGALLDSPVMTEVCNTFLRHFAAGGERSEVVALAKMMKRKGIEGDDETAQLIRESVMGGGSSSGGEGGASGRGQRGAGSSEGGGSFKFVLAALLALGSASLYAASEHGIALLDEQKTSRGPTPDATTREAVAEEYQWALQESQKCQRLIGTAERAVQDKTRLSDRLTANVKEVREELAEIGTKIEAEVSAAPTSYKRGALMRLGHKGQGNRELQTRRQMLSAALLNGENKMEEIKKEVAKEEEDLIRRKEYAEYLAQSAKEAEAKFEAITSDGGRQAASSALIAACLSIAEARLQLEVSATAAYESATAAD